MSNDIILALGITVVGLMAFAIVMARREKAAITAMGATDHFQMKGFEASIDRARREVHIRIEGHARLFCAPFGHLVVEHKVQTLAVAHEKRPKRRCRLARASNPRRLLKSGRYVAPSSGWKETVWSAVETGNTHVRVLAVRLPAYYAQHWTERKEERTPILTDAMDMTLPNQTAQAFKRWLDHHGPELFPDRAAARARWDQTCAELLRACRQQRDHHESAAGAFETWSFSAQPTIAYLVIEADGAAFWASGNTPMLELVEKPLFKLTGDRFVVSSGDDHRSLPLPADRMATVQALRGRGVIRMG